MARITHSPEEEAIEEELHKRLKDGRKFAVCYICLNGLEPYSDRYGSQSGRGVIGMTGELLDEILRERGLNGDIVARAGGDGFIILTSIETVEPLCSTIIEGFDERIRGHYDDGDLEKGYVAVTDGDGHETKYPIMTISISVVHNEYRSFTDISQIGYIAAELKAYARNLEGSVCVVDRRKA